MQVVSTRYKGLKTLCVCVCVSAGPTRFTRQLGDIFKIQLGTLGRLDCEADADPSVDISFTWTKDGQPLVLGQR